jgi:hypothetical protein
MVGLGYSLICFNYSFNVSKNVKKIYKVIVTIKIYIPSGLQINNHLL